MSPATLVIAPDSFKGGLSAPEICRALEEGVLRVDPKVLVRRKPLADGGEGTAAALLAARPGGVWIPATVAGPLPERTVKAGFAWFPEDRTAVVEMASANGLALLTPGERNPLRTSTLGTGQLLDAAARQGAARILLAIGGSATVDGGIGAAAALGWRFLDACGQAVSPSGGGLRRIVRIVPPPPSALPLVTVLCDVTHPLCGPQGAAAVFGPQKGATPAMIRELEAGLEHLAGQIAALTGRDLRAVPGGGAAGGLGAGALAFLPAHLQSGIETVIEVSRFREALEGADWCVTGEGSFDAQSLRGKVVSGVAAAARRAAIPLAVFAGRVRLPPRDYRRAGIRHARAIHAPDMPLDEALRREPALLRTAAARWWRGLTRQCG